MKNNKVASIVFLTIILQISFMQICYSQQQNSKLRLEIDVPSEILSKAKQKKLLNIQDVQNLLNEIFRNLSNEKISITCQAITPQGKYLGSFDNPSFDGHSIPGGQSKVCNIWLVDDSQINVATQAFKEKEKNKKNQSDIVKKQSTPSAAIPLKNKPQSQSIKLKFPSYESSSIL